MNSRTPSNPLESNPQTESRKHKIKSPRGSRSRDFRQMENSPLRRARKPKHNNFPYLPERLDRASVRFAEVTVVHDDGVRDAPSRTGICLDAVEIDSSPVPLPNASNPAGDIGR